MSAAATASTNYRLLGIFRFLGFRFCLGSNFQVYQKWRKQIAPNWKWKIETKSSFLHCTFRRVSSSRFIFGNEYSVDAIVCCAQATHTNIKIYICFLLLLLPSSIYSVSFFEAIERNSAVHRLKTKCDRRWCSSTLDFSFFNDGECSFRLPSLAGARCWGEARNSVENVRRHRMMAIRSKWREKENSKITWMQPQ